MAPEARSEQMSVDWAALRQAINDLVAEKKCGPILVRLSWHDAGTYCKRTKTGGAHACQRFAKAGEWAHGANKGLDVAQALLEPIRAKFPTPSSADLWAFAAVVAIKAMGGPDVPFRAGRTDGTSVESSVEDGRLPDATQGAQHIRDVFYRIGMDDEEIVALSGAHTVGKCHLERSGFDGPWTADPQKFDNTYFIDLLKKKWDPATSGAGNPQFVNTDTKTMMLPADLALVDDAAFRKYVEKFASSQDAFFKAFAAAFKKLQESGYDESALVAV
ncbi:Plant heme peroxidase family profile domain-containing protein [Plasmodiophora brassicae]